MLRLWLRYRGIGLATGSAVRLKVAFLSGGNQRESDMEDRKFLVSIQLDRSSDPTRISNDVPAIVSMLSGFSSKNPEVAFRSSDGQTFGFFIKTSKPATMIRGEFQNLMNTSGKDAFFIFEVGGECASTEGYTRAATWFQRN